MLRDKGVYEDTVIDPTSLGGADDVAIRCRRITAIAKIQASVSQDILSSIAEYEENPSKLWIYLRTLYESNNAEWRLMLTKKLATVKPRASVTVDVYLQTI